MGEQPSQKQRKRTIEPVAAPVAYPPACDPSDIYALQAVYNGRATPDQQRRAIDFIIKEICGMRHHAAVLGPDSQLLTYQALGRQHAGRVITDLLTVRINVNSEQP